jgi:hypothetical protein
MQTVVGLGPVMRLIYAAPEAAVREMLTEAMVNPVFARDLLSRASPASMERAMGYVERNMGERLRAAAGEATVRQGVRSTGAVAQQERPRMPMNPLMGGAPGAGASPPRNQLMAVP